MKSHTMWLFHFIMKMKEEEKGEEYDAESTKKNDLDRSIVDCSIAQRFRHGSDHEITGPSR